MDVTGMKSDDIIAKGKERMAWVDEDGVTFKSPLNGDAHRFSAEISMGIQHKIGADIMFAFDELTTLMNTRSYQEDSVERTFRWARRCVEEHQRLTATRLGKPYQALYGVVQGANYEDLRRRAASQIASLDFDGVGIGGAIEKRIIGDTCAWICDAMPESRPRHVLGIASVDDIFACVENGGDTFDCVAPARCARNGAIYTRAAGTTSSAPSTSSISGRWRPGAIATRASTIRARMSITCCAPASSTGSHWPRFITSISS